MNGISIQPKIGSDPFAQYGVGNSSVANTMTNATNASGQFYDTSRVTQNSNPEKIAENISKYETAQANQMRQFHGI